MAILLEAELSLFRNDFIKRNIGRYSTTPRLYAGDIKNLSTKPVYESPEELAIDLIEGVNRARKGDKYKPRTRNRFVFSTRAFLRFLERKRKIDESTLNSFLPCLDCEKVKEEALPTIAYSEFEKIMGVIPSGTYLGSRDRAFFYLIANEGLRGSEVVNLAHGCLKEDRGNLTVEVQGKYKIRTLTLNTDTTKEVKNYLQQKKQRYVELPLEPLFSNKKRDKPICDRQLRRKFQGYAEKAGVKAELHYLRNSYMKALVDSDKSAEELTELTGIGIEHVKTIIRSFSKN